MSQNNSDRANLLPAGAVFHRCALQVNPHSYAAFRGQPDLGDPAKHAREIVDKALELGITVLAITNHNDASAVPVFRAAAEGRGVLIFPGFELASNEGVHILCIYSPESDQEKLSRFLGEFGITNTTPSADLSNCTFAEILSKVRSQGGVTVAAHASNSSGMLKVFSGQPRIRAWKNPDLLAIQIPGQIKDLPFDLLQIVENRNPDYSRSEAAEERLAVAVVNAKDVVNAADLENRSASCLIKMSDVSVEGLRQAFLDPGSRIRLIPPEGSHDLEQHAELLSLAWEGGFLDGAMVRFNANLNVLVGGRGAGKSTIIESIRAVLGLEPVGDEARKAHEGIVRQVLRNGTKISLRVRVYRPSKSEYLIERTIPNPPIVRDNSGQVSKLTAGEVLPRVEVHGQHEISELTKSREKLTRLLDRFMEPDETLVRRKTDLRRELEKSRVSLVQTRSELRQVEERLDALPSLEETLARFKEAGLEERLKERSLLIREEQILTSIPERMAGFRACLDNLTAELPFDRAFLSAKAIEDLPGKEILDALNPVLFQLGKDLGEVRSAFNEALQRADAGVESVKLVWNVRKQKVQIAYEKILRDLQKTRVDGEEFIRLRRQIEPLRPLRENQAALLHLEKELSDRRRSLLADWEDIKAEAFRQIDRAAKKVNQRLRERVQVEVTAGGDREPLYKILREDVGGRLSEAIELLKNAPDLSLTKLVEACRMGHEAVTKAFGITTAQAERLARVAPEILMRIEELNLLPTTTIRLNTSPQGDPPSWQTLENLSTGQKATAVLLMLLLESDAPLIVDQPEDDLDNRFITEGVVPRMREEKLQRQFIFSTHNANIPVLGDAELIIGLTAAGEAAHGRALVAPKHMGSIDDRLVRELVEEILEGGKAAFERRRRKYGF